ELLADRYEVKSLVGQGPLGVVVRALDREVDVEIGLKLVAPRLLQSADERTEFLRLLRQAKRLSHPNLVRVYEMGVLEGESGAEGAAMRPFYTMQLLDGLTLRRVVDLRREKGQLFTLREVEPIVAQIALGLDHVFDSGPHTDIKPDNVVVLPDLLKVTDYGLGPAIPRLPFVAAQRARKADVYLAPELLAGRPVDARSDVYSIGVILGEMLGGVLPSPHGGALLELRSKNPELPPAIEALYRRAVAANPDSRFSKAGDLAAELGALAERTAPPLPKAAPPTRRAPPPPPPDLTPAEAMSIPRREKTPAHPTTAPATPPPPPSAPRSPPQSPTDGAPPPAQATKSSRAAALRPRQPGAIPIDSGPRPGRSPPPPPVEPERGRRFGLMWFVVVLLALSATGVYGYRSFAGWKIAEQRRLPERFDSDTASALAAVASLDAGSGWDAGPVGVVPKAASEAAHPTLGQSVTPVASTATSSPPSNVARPSTAGTPEEPDGGIAQSGVATRDQPPRHRSERTAPGALADGSGTSCPPGMRFIRQGSALLGTPASDDLGNFGDRPARRISVRGYCIDLYEYPNRSEAKPLVGVSFGAASAACGRDGKRLCSEDEWEKACKGPDDLRFPYGQGFDASACNASKTGLRGAGSFSRCRSGYGLFDMSGNAAEWTLTRFESGVSDRTVKGGAFDGQDADLRCSARQNRPPGSHSSSLGFRCCGDPR
ncbi:MAG: bifunctional serine/threonine-protein kinase/formylglycine-generating enzyme family protein, partial [Deltaproteobacteria bacterium]